MAEGWSQGDHVTSHAVGGGGGGGGRKHQQEMELVYMDILVNSIGQVEVLSQQQGLEWNLQHEFNDMTVTHTYHDTH